MAFRKTSILFVVLLSALSSFSWAEEADLILVNGKVISVDAAFSIHTALAVKDGKVLAVGPDAEIRSLKGPETREIDLQGKSVMPGLIDSHTHSAGAAVIEFDHEIPDMDSIGDVLDYIAARTKVVPEGEWIVVSQVFLTRLEEQRYPTRAELDEIAPKHPVAFQTGPDASVNSLALRVSGIDEAWKVDDGGPGYAEKDPETGRLTGIIRSCTRYLKIKRNLKRPSAEEHNEYLKRLIADYNRVGITAYGERDADERELEQYRQMSAAGDLNARVFVSKHIETLPTIPEIKQAIIDAAQSPLFKDGNDMLRLGAVKAYLDGGMLTGSAAMREPWGTSKIYGITDPEYRGLLFIPQDKLDAILETCFENHIQFMAHGVGDRAVHTFIDAVAKLSDRFDIRSERPVICHSNFMSPEAVARVAELGIGMDIQPAWLYSDARTLVSHFGYDRLAWFQPLRALFDAGAIAGGGSDHMQKIGSLRSINIYDPWLGMWVTVTRMAKWLNEPLHPEHALSRVEAIRFYTVNNAYLFGMEDRLGSLESGKWADFIILSDDPLTCSNDELREMKVLETYLAGRAVHSAR